MTLTRRLVVVGAPAYAIGILLTLTFPLLFGIGLLLGVFEAAMAHGQPLDPQRFMQKYWYLDLVAVPVMLLIVAIIALAAPKGGEEENVGQERPLGPPPSFPPPDPSNPYASPYSDSRQPPFDEA